MKKLFGTCASCGYWYLETLWIGKDNRFSKVLSELNQPKDYPCECGGVVIEDIIDDLTDAEITRRLNEV